MSLQEREYIRDSSEENRPFSSSQSIFILIALNVIVYLVVPIGSRLWLNDFALSSIGIQHLKLWQSVTYMFLHAGVAHLVFNMWGVYMFGSLVVPFIGTLRFLTLYFLSGVCGAGLWLIFNWGSRVPVVGASGAIFGVMMASAMLHPDLKVQLIFPPIPIKMKFFVSIYGIIEIVSELSNVQGNVAHLAHLGGFLGAYGYMKYLYGAQVWDIFGVFSSRKTKKSKLPKGWSVYSNDEPQTPVSKDEIDRLLDKISVQGMQSLTEEEMATLKRASAEMQSRPT